MSDSLNNKELVAVGHQFAKAMSADTPIIDMAKIVSRLAESLAYAINSNNQPEYHDQGMGCGVEDHGYQKDGYAACEYGWQQAMNRVYSEVIPEAMPVTPDTDAFLAEVRAHGVEMFAKEMHADISEADALEFAAQLRQEAAQ